MAACRPDSSARPSAERSDSKSSAEPRIATRRWFTPNQIRISERVISWPAPATKSVNWKRISGADW